VQALRAPKTRGRWGEMQLRQVFEMAGMAEHVDYLSERTVETDAGARRPDAVVRIPGGKSIVVDAKTPLEAYLDALEADGPEAQGEHLTRHAAQVRAHVKTLASKAYQDAIPTTPDFVVMFIPGETFVSAAAEADPGLIEYAFERKVLIATPTTLMALIKAIAYGWQQEKMAENAAEVQRLAKEIYDRLGTFADHLGRVGRSLRSSVDAYNRAVGSLEGRVLPSARKFEGAALDPVDEEPRPLTAPELTRLDDG
jgi:DNA recombination protein RmuC